MSLRRGSWRLICPQRHLQAILTPNTVVRPTKLRAAVHEPETFPRRGAHHRTSIPKLLKVLKQEVTRVYILGTESHRRSSEDLSLCARLDICPVNHGSEILRHGKASFPLHLRLRPGPPWPSMQRRRRRSRVSGFRGDSGFPACGFESWSPEASGPGRGSRDEG